MQSSAEVLRLKTVYHDYEQRKLADSRWSPNNPGNQAIRAERDRSLQTALQKAGLLPLVDCRVLDVGCGSGGVLANLQNWGAKQENLVGVDLLPERIKMAQELFPNLSFQPANAEALPFADCAFDLVVLFTVLSSILSAEMARNIARQATRVLRSGGAIVWYDFRVDNPFNRQVRGIARGTLSHLFPGFQLRLEPVTLVPQLARRLGSLTRWLYPALSTVCVLRTHYAGLLTKP
jgi:ubiquinone/menaquinone biosynthesis C-methylase UbiE